MPICRICGENKAYYEVRFEDNTIICGECWDEIQAAKAREESKKGRTPR